MKVRVNIINAFVEKGAGGNPAGVVLNADLFSSKQKLAVAKAVGLSETAFVSSSKVADFKLDFFTPTRQIAHCGHATVATFSYLSQLNMVPNKVTSKETIDGIRKIELVGDRAYMEQTAPKYQTVEQYHRSIFAALGIAESDVLFQPKLVNTGNSFIVVGVKSQECLANIVADLGKINLISQQLDLIGFYVFTLATNKESSDASSRMFAPRYGIDEESATGMAAGPLACFLYEHVRLNKSEFFIEQGYYMSPASPSLINVKLALENSTISSVSAGGHAQVSGFLEVEI